MNVPRLRKAALYYAAQLGLEVFPLARGQKCPLISRGDGGRGVHDATTNPMQVAKWWESAPAANVGIALGLASGVWVLDVDRRNEGHTSLGNLIARYGQLPTTPMVATGNGQHYYWRFDAAQLANVTWSKVTKGVDIQGPGQYVVAPPSVHPTGTVYEWTVAPWQVDFAFPPDWLLGLLPRVRPIVLPPRPVNVTNAERRARLYVQRMDPAISGQGGHTATMRAAAACVAKFGLNKDEALRVLVEEFNPRCEPAWSRRELEHKVSSALRGRREVAA